MRIVVSLALVALLAAPAASQDRARAGPAPARDASLERSLAGRLVELARSLTPEAKTKLDAAARTVLSALASDADERDPRALAQQQVQIRFGRVSSDQADLLALHILGTVAERIADPDQRRRVARSDEASARVQMLLDRRSRLMTTLSNLMKKTSDTHQAVIQNIK